MIHHFKTNDCPDANGREPKEGEHKWALMFPLENGDDYLVIEIGQRGHDALKVMFAQEEAEDARVKGRQKRRTFSDPDCAYFSSQDEADTE